ncbi:MAG TPA: amidohydrolase family protein [Sphingobium sp.]
MKRTIILLAAPALIASTVSRSSSSPQPVHDILIRGGTIVDGTGRPRFRADVLIDNGVISQIGKLGGAHARKVIDASGLIVAPGFINPHSHAEADAVSTAANMLEQGVTTEIMNPDGDGETDIVPQLRRFAAQGLAINLGAYIGFNSVWEQTMGLADRRASPAQIDEMRGVIDRNLSNGAWGVSAGLDYKPGYYATKQEVVNVIGAASPWRTNFPNHERVTPPQYSSYTGMAETIDIASSAGLMPVITHIKSQGHERGRAPAVLDMMRRGTPTQPYVTGDVYPYLAGLTYLSDLLVPAWAQDGGRPAMLKRFGDPAMRGKIVQEAETVMNVRLAGGAEGVTLADTGERLVDIAARDKVSPGEAMVRVLEKGQRPAVLAFGSESDLQAFLRSPAISITCDCGASLEGHGHPRYFGTWPRVLGHYVRDTKVISLEEAVRKMTALPASTIGMVDRGLLAPGMAADVAIFDATKIADRATYAAATLSPVGMRYVLVNGGLAWADGHSTGTRMGTLVFRQRWMPSRAMDLRRAGNIDVAGPVVAFDRHADLVVKLTQASGQQARGLVQIKSGDRILYTALRFGWTQRSSKWLSVTGIGRDAKGKISGFTLTLDGGDPADRRPVTHLVLESRDVRWKGDFPAEAPAATRH